ncbi:hypothetical protein RSAG8_07668, partial [Rhizoctonia solani AG-8 WAC10335]
MDTGLNESDMPLIAPPIPGAPSDSPIASRSKNRKKSYTEKELKARKRRLELNEQNKAIDPELEVIGEEVDRLLGTAASRLNLDPQQLTSKFLAAQSASHSACPTAWHGFVSKMSSEWKSEGEALGYTGMTYMNWVVKRIGDEDLYTNLIDEKKEEMVKYAEELRASRLSAGSVRTGEHRLTQGNIKNELFNMCERLRYLSDKTGIEVISIVVRGDKAAGLKPIYFASKKARRFLESHVRVDAEEFIELLEKSAIGGAAELGNEHEKKKNVVKSELRDVLTDSLRDAALETASDGWKPVISDRSEIGQMTYTRYPHLVMNYGVELFGWPMVSEYVPKDPSQLGGKGVMSVLTAKIKTNPATAGFRRLTKNEWEEWKEKYYQQVAGGSVVKECQPRSDKGKSRKAPRAEELVCEPPKKRTKAASKGEGATEPNVSSCRELVTGSEKPSESVSRPETPFQFENTPNDSPPLPASRSSPHEQGTSASTEDFSPALPPEHSRENTLVSSPSTVQSVLDPAPVGPLVVVSTSVTVPLASSTAPSTREPAADLSAPSPTYPLFPVIQSSAPIGSVPGTPTSVSTSVSGRAPSPITPGYSHSKPSTPRRSHSQQINSPITFKVIYSPETYATRPTHTRQRGAGHTGNTGSRSNSPCTRPTPTPGPQAPGLTVPPGNSVDQRKGLLVPNSLIDPVLLNCKHQSGYAPSRM